MNTSANNHIDQELIDSIKTNSELSKNKRKKLIKDIQRKEYYRQKKEEQKKKRKLTKDGTKNTTEKEKNNNQIEKEKYEDIKRVKRELDIHYVGNLIIDCSFEHLLTPKELQSLSNQIHLGYGYNKSKRFPKRFHLHLTGFDSSEQGKLHCSLNKLSGFKNWKEIAIHPERPEELFDKNKIIYLTPESSTVLESIEPDKIIVIGGIVDRNRLKGHCQKQCNITGIQTACLPLHSYSTLKNSKVLTTLNVLEILVNYIQNNDWNTAFRHCLPKRHFPHE